MRPWPSINNKVTTSSVSFSGNMKTNNVFSLSICTDVKWLFLAGAAVSFLAQSICRQTIAEHMGAMHFGLHRGCIWLKSLEAVEITLKNPPRTVFGGALHCTAQERPIPCPCWTVVEQLQFGNCQDILLQKRLTSWNYIISSFCFGGLCVCFLKGGGFMPSTKGRVLREGKSNARLVMLVVNLFLGMISQRIMKTERTLHFAISHLDKILAYSCLLLFLVSSVS